MKLLVANVGKTTLQAASVYLFTQWSVRCYALIHASHSGSCPHCFHQLGGVRTSNFQHTDKKRNCRQLLECVCLLPRCRQNGLENPFPKYMRLTVSFASETVSFKHAIDTVCSFFYKAQNKPSILQIRIKVGT